MKDLHADNSLVNFAADRICTTRYVTTKHHNNRFLSVLLKIIEMFLKNHVTTKTDHSTWEIFLILKSWLLSILETVKYLVCQFCHKR